MAAPPTPSASAAGPAVRRVVRLERFGPPEAMSWGTGPMPVCGNNEVLVEVDAIGVNFGDTMVRRGEYRRGQTLDEIPGFELAGTVVAGPDSGPGPGQRVVGFAEHGGGYADHVVLPVDRVFPVRDGIATTTAAALFTQGVTAWYGVHRFGRVGEGDQVLVPGGAGGLGQWCIRLVVAAGAQAIALASSAEKRQRCLDLGATEALDPDPATLTAALRERTGGRGVDVVLDGVGGELFAPAMRALAHNGRYVVLGSASQEPALLDVRALLPRGQTIAGVLVARVAEQDPAEPRRAFDAVQALVADGVVRPQVTVLPADDVVAAHRAIEARRSVGKLVLDLHA
ncbi:MAG: zinc-binding dehydrogenase [Patulibacter sp.]